MSKKHSQSVQIFENAWMERLTRVHPIVPLLIWGTVTLLLIWRCCAVHGFSSSAVLTYAVVGLMSWSLFEYAIHRFFFHWEAKSDWGRRMIFVIHQNHHEVPNDPMRLLFPPIVSVSVFCFLYTVFASTTSIANTEAFLAFFVLGYLIYDYTHFATHHYMPRTTWGRMIKQNHMLHHFADSRTRYGVSSPIWDYVFGTIPEKSETKHSA